MALGTKLSTRYQTESCESGKALPDCCSDSQFQIPAPFPHSGSQIPSADFCPDFQVLIFAQIPWRCSQRQSLVMEANSRMHKKKSFHEIPSDEKYRTQHVLNNSSDLCLMIKFIFGSVSLKTKDICDGLSTVLNLIDCGFDEVKSPHNQKIVNKCLLLNRRESQTYSFMITDFSFVVGLDTKTITRSFIFLNQLKLDIRSAVNNFVIFLCDVQHLPVFYINKLKLLHQNLKMKKK